MQYTYDVITYYGEYYVVHFILKDYVSNDENCFEVIIFKKNTCQTSDKRDLIYTIY